jgi:tetratricopeptide (TPR) repeat protein
MRQFLLFLSCLFLLPSAMAQTKEQITEDFDDAEYFFKREDYKEAAYYYKKVLDQYPENANFNFKLGECYLNISGEESKAVPYLENAVKSTVEKKRYKSNSFEEKNAPLHAYFYLGNAYRINNQLDKAMNAYQTFINSPYYYGNYNESIVENEIKACERALIIRDSPINMDEELLPDPVNSASSELHPVVSDDEKTIVFIRKLKFYDAILLCTFDGKNWSQPLNLNPLLGSDGDFYPTSLSSDGKELYLVKTASGGGDIYVSFYRDNTWTKPEKLGKPVNSVSNETSAFISADGQWLYFSSDRAGGKGGLDIYVAKRIAGNQWGKAKNAGKAINSAFDEDSPCLTHEGNIIYFSSKGHYSMGGYDLFYSTKNGRKWSTPVNAGYPLNSTADNNFFAVKQGGKIMYCSKINTVDQTSEDLYKYVISSNLPLP